MPTWSWCCLPVARDLDHGHIASPHSEGARWRRGPLSSSAGCGPASAVYVADAVAVAAANTFYERVAAPVIAAPCCWAPTACTSSSALCPGCWPLAKTVACLFVLWDAPGLPSAVPLLPAGAGRDSAVPGGHRRRWARERWAGRPHRQGSSFSPFPSPARPLLSPWASAFTPRNAGGAPEEWRSSEATVSRRERLRPTASAQETRGSARARCLLHACIIGCTSMCWQSMCWQRRCCMHAPCMPLSAVWRCVMAGIVCWLALCAGWHPRALVSTITRCSWGTAPMTYEFTL